MARPRDLDLVRERMLRDAARPGFAEVAEYAIPRGGKTITGMMIATTLEQRTLVLVHTTDLLDQWEAVAADAMTADAVATALFFDGGPALAADWGAEWVRMRTDGAIEWSPRSEAELFL
jgi:hypothetical protein